MDAGIDFFEFTPRMILAGVDALVEFHREGPDAPPGGEGMIGQATT